MMKSMIATTALLLAALPAQAAYMNGYQVVEDFDALTNSWDGVIMADGLPSTLSGGVVQTYAVDLDPAYVPYSFNNVYFGREITLQLGDPFNDSYAAFGAFVTGSAVVTLDVYAYDYDLATEVFYGSASTDGTNTLGSALPPNFYLSVANAPGGSVLTRAVFRSAGQFAIDNLSLGLPDVPPGIPEPGSWAMMIAGFALAGGAMRARRGAVA